jgi:hypothetical protein
MKDVFFSSSLYDEEQFFPLDDQTPPTDEEILSCPSSSTRIIYTDEDQGLANDPFTKVRFHEFMKVVLIPTKEEYKRAKCDLWWKRADFMFFQRSAGQEIRYFAALQNLNLQEAKRQLYQPKPEDDGGDDTLLLMKETDTDPFHNFGTNQRLYRSRTDSEESVDEQDRQTCSQELKKLSEEQQQQEHLLQQNEHTKNLNLCVAVEDLVPASNNVRVSKYRSTLMSAGLLTAMGIVSFAAPLIGFYFLSSH